MKFLSLAVASTAMFLASGVAKAQLVICYDAITTRVAPIRFNTAAGFNLIGDVTSTPVCATICQVEIVFVASAAGNYLIDFDLWNPNCLGCPAAPAIPITIPAGTFPAAFLVTLTVPAPCIPGPWPAFSVISNSTNFVPAWTVQPAIPNGVDGISVDINPNDGCLDPNFPGCPVRTPPPPLGGPEWFTSGNQTNLLVRLSRQGPTLDTFLRGPFVRPDLAVQAVERLDDLVMKDETSLKQIKPAL